MANQYSWIWRKSKEARGDIKTTYFVTVLPVVVFLFQHMQTIVISLKDKVLFGGVLSKNPTSIYWTNVLRTFTFNEECPFIVSAK